MIRLKLSMKDLADVAKYGEGGYGLLEIRAARLADLSGMPVEFQRLDGLIHTIFPGARCPPPGRT